MVGERIRTFRVAEGLTQQQLAARAGLTQSAISSYESGRAEPSLETLRQLARALKIQPRDLLPDLPTGRDAPAGAE